MNAMLDPNETAAPPPPGESPLADVGSTSGAASAMDPADPVGEGVTAVRFYCTAMGHFFAGFAETPRPTEVRET